MASIATINVIDCTDAETFNVKCLRSYPDTAEGNEEAEETFREWISESADANNPLSEEDIDAAIENGIFEIGQGFIALVHSN